MRARMYVGTRVWGEEPRTLYPGDVIDGALAHQQVALGNAEELKEDVHVDRDAFIDGSAIDRLANAVAQRSEEEKG